MEPTFLPYCCLFVLLLMFFQTWLCCKLEILLPQLPEDGYHCSATPRHFHTHLKLKQHEELFVLSVKISPDFSSHVLWLTYLFQLASCQASNLPIKDRDTKFYKGFYKQLIRLQLQLNVQGRGVQVQRTDSRLRKHALAGSVLTGVLFCIECYPQLCLVVSFRLMCKMCKKFYCFNSLFFG